VIIFLVVAFILVRYQAEYHMHPQNVFYPKSDYPDSIFPGPRPYPDSWRHNPSCPEPNHSINQSLMPNGKRFVKFLFSRYTETIWLIIV